MISYAFKWSFHIIFDIPGRYTLYRYKWKSSFISFPAGLFKWTWHHHWRVYLSIGTSLKGCLNKSASTHMSLCKNTTHNKYHFNLVSAICCLVKCPPKIFLATHGLFHFHKHFKTSFFCQFPQRKPPKIILELYPYISPPYLLWLPVCSYTSWKTVYSR